MMRLVGQIALALALSASAIQADPISQARDALGQLDRAAAALGSAKKARDRVAALTETVQGFETGLAAIRDGLRAVTIREQSLARELGAKREEMARLLGVLQTIGRQNSPTILVHPSGPTGTARAGILLASVTPALNDKVRKLNMDLTEVATLRELQQAAADKLQTGLGGVQEARTALSQAIADRTDLPQRFTEDPQRIASLIDSAQTLAGFASGLVDDDGSIAIAAAQDLTGALGTLPMPVEGTVLHAAGEPDAAGIVRPGIIVATRPRALVTSPVSATIRYRGPLLDYGQVMILEPQTDILLVLAGLDVVFGEIGQVLPQGAPIGLMGGEDPGLGSILSQSGDGTTVDRSESLSIEIRTGDETADPLQWFRIQKG